VLPLSGGAGDIRMRGLVVEIPERRDGAPRDRVVVKAAAN